MALLHDLDDVVIRTISVSEMSNNVYLITSKETGIQVLIDAADDVDAIERMLTESIEDSLEPTRLALIATTHQHADHVRALAQLAEDTDALLGAGEVDADAIEEATGATIDVRFEHGDVAKFEGFDLTAIHLRGHTPGSIAYVYDDPTGVSHIFSGDSLFPGGVGNTQGDAARFESLLADVEERLFGAYPDESHVHPGHGDATTLGTERPHLGEWRERGW